MVLPYAQHIYLPQQDESKGEAEAEGELITDEIVAVKKEITADDDNDDIADEMVDDEVGGGKEAEVDRKKEQEKDSVEKQGGAESSVASWQIWSKLARF